MLLKEMDFKLNFFAAKVSSYFWVKLKNKIVKTGLPFRSFAFSSINRNEKRIFAPFFDFQIGT